jgi:hypothetical protein
MTEAATEAVVRRAVHVKAPIGRTFTVFVEQMGHRTQVGSAAPCGFLVAPRPGPWRTGLGHEPEYR